jgi:hypothetical protein
VDRLPTTAPTPLHHVAYLQGFTILIDLQAVRPNLTKEERNQFLLKDLAVDIVTITDVFMVPSTQLYGQPPPREAAESIVASVTAGFLPLSPTLPQAPVIPQPGGSSAPSLPADKKPLLLQCRGLGAA